MKRLFSVIIMIIGLSLDAFSQGDGPMTAYSMVTRDGRGYIVRLRETEGRPTVASIRQHFLKSPRMIRTDILENDLEPIRNRKISLKPYEYASVRIAPERLVKFSEPASDGYEYTGLVTCPRAIHGGEDGQLYLEWGAILDKDFDHYELYRSTEPDFVCTPDTFVSDVRNEVYDGIPYRIARYEDTGLDSHRRYYYRIRPVYKDGAKGAFSDPFSAITRQMIRNE